MLLPADGVGWGGGWDVNVIPCTSYITCCYAVEISGIVATSHVVTLLMVWRCNVAKDARLKELGTLAKTCKWKIQKLRFFNVWGQKMNASTTVNSWKRLQSHANTNRNASHVRMRMSQNPGRVAKLQTEMLEKRSNCAGSLRAAWPCFARANANVARFKSNFLLIKLFIFWDMPCQWCADSPFFC